MIETRGDARATDSAQLLVWALRETGRHLHFGLEHTTSFAFDGTEREGNCLEYAHLFARLFNDAAKARQVNAMAFAVHSSGATLLGYRIPLPALQDHDWVLIVERDADGNERRRYHVDPSFYDAGLDWNIERAVQGNVASARK
jgi:hypothetical protein